MAFSLFACDTSETPGNNEGDSSENNGSSGSNGNSSNSGDTDTTSNLGKMYAESFLSELTKVKSITMMLTLATEAYTGEYTDGLGNTDGSEETTDFDYVMFDVIVSLSDDRANVCLTPIDTNTEDSSYAIYVIDGVVYEYDGKTDVYTELVDVDNVIATIGLSISDSIKVENGSIVIDEDIAESLTSTFADNYKIDVANSAVISEISFAAKPEELIKYLAEVDLSTASTAEIINTVASMLGAEIDLIDAIGSLKGNGEITVGEMVEATNSALANLNTDVSTLWGALIASDEAAALLTDSGIVDEEGLANLRALDINAFLSENASVTLNEIVAMLITSDEGEAATADDVIDAALSLLSMPAENLGVFTREMQYRLANTTIDSASIGISFSLDKNTEGLPSFYAKFQISSIDIHDDGAQYVAKVSFTALAMIDVIVLSEHPLYIGLPKN